MFKFIKEHKRGVIGTTMFHVLLLIFFLLYKGFSTPLPLPDEDGILVNIGNTETGIGEVEPMQAEVTPSEEVQEVVEEIPEVEEAIEEFVEQTEEEILTQDIEDAPEVKEAERKKKEEEEKEKKRVEEEKKKERERIAELERIAEKRKQDSITEVRRIEQEQKAAELRDKIAKGFTGSQSQGEGETGGEGNQGKTGGDPYANNYDGSSKGNGVSWSLSGRNPQKLPKPEYINQENGIIVVEVIVNQQGDVIDATPGKKGSTTTNNKLMEAARKAALKAKFDTKPDAPPRQTGTITYQFILE